MADKDGSTAVVDAPADWRTFANDEMKADPVVSNFLEKASEKDIPSIIKGYAHASHRLGSAVNFPAKDAKTEDIEAFRAKVYESGVFQAPPATPEDYGIAKPERLPDGIGWDDNLGKGLATVLHKYRVPKEAAAELLKLHEDSVVGAQAALKTNMETGLAALRTEFKEDFDARKEMVKRMMPAIFKSKEEVAFAEATGLADHPLFLGPLMRLAPLAQQDSSFMATIAQPGGELTGDEVRKQVQDIMTNKDNPHHAGYLRGDKAVLDHIDSLYKKAYGNKPVDIGGGLSASSGKTQ